MVSAVSGRGHQGIQKGQSLPEHCRGSIRTPSLDTQVPCGVRLLRMPHFHHRLPRAQFGFHLTPGRHEVQMGVGVPNPPSPQLGPRVGHSHSPALGQLVTVRLAPSVGGWCHYDAILQVQRERSWPQATGRLSWGWSQPGLHPWQQAAPGVSWQQNQLFRAQLEEQRQVPGGPVALAQTQLFLFLPWHTTPPSSAHEGYPGKTLVAREHRPAPSGQRHANCQPL